MECLMLSLLSKSVAAKILNILLQAHPMSKNYTSKLQELDLGRSGEDKEERGRAHRFLGRGKAARWGQSRSRGGD